MEAGRRGLAVMLVVLAAVGCAGSSQQPSRASASSADSYDEPHHGRTRRHRTHFFDILMDNPFGVHTPPAPECQALLESCAGDEECCNETGFEACNVAGNNECCLENDAPCSPWAPDECCIGNCAQDTLGQPYICTPGCFAGDTRIRVQTSDRRGSTLKAIRDVQTGEFLQCINSTEDLRVPTTLDWCEVMNWAHAEDTPALTHYRMTFTRPTGGQGSLTMSLSHMMYKLTSAAVGDEAESVDQFGAFSLVQAQAIKPGDRLAVLKDEDNPAAGFQVVNVTSAQRVAAGGYYLLTMRKGYLLADGVVSPRSLDFGIPYVGGEGLDGVKQVIPLYMFGPMYMNRYQPLGTAGTNGSWDGKTTWPGLADVGAAWATHLDAGEYLDYNALQDWFMPLYATWLANASATISLDTVLDLLRGDTIWVKPSRRARASKPKKRRSWFAGA